MSISTVRIGSGGIRTFLLRSLSYPIETIGRIKQGLHPIGGKWISKVFAMVLLIVKKENPYQLSGNFSSESNI
jgi:hypothetical protein